MTPAQPNGKAVEQSTNHLLVDVEASATTRHVMLNAGHGSGPTPSCPTFHCVASVKGSRCRLVIERVWPCTLKPLSVPHHFRQTLLHTASMKHQVQRPPFAQLQRAAKNESCPRKKTTSTDWVLKDDASTNKRDSKGVGGGRV